MNLGVKKSGGRHKCRNRTCKQNPEYINDNGRIKKDTTCAWVSIDDAGGGATAYYCRECIDVIHMKMRQILNPQLWVLK